MSLSVWPPIPPHELAEKAAQSLVGTLLFNILLTHPLSSKPSTVPCLELRHSFISHRLYSTTMLIKFQDNELQWFIAETIQKCQELKHGLEDCYALLAPIDPGSTLVMSTSRSERVKGTITRVGTRIVKGVRSPPSHFFHASGLTLASPSTSNSRQYPPKAFTSHPTTTFTSNPWNNSTQTSLKPSTSSA